MLAALIKGKLTRKQENMEDLLTSNVFGLMRYLPPHEALVPFLSQVEDLNGVRPLSSLSINAEVQYDFWPRIEEPGCISCEPDLILRITDNQCCRLIFIEAKYLSGKSSEEDSSVVEPYDQLAREWDNLASMAAREQVLPLLIYVTADVGLPRQDLETSAEEFCKKRGIGKQAFSCAWISWRRISTVFQNANTDATHDLRAMANRLGLCYFQSIRPPDAKSLTKWHFDNDFHWKVPRTIAGIWSYSK